MRSTKPILLVEDDVVDAMTVKRALRDIDADQNVVHMTNGEEALHYLQSNDSQKPFVILLDLNMPKMNGLEFLRIIKSDEALKKIPVIVLTTSKNSTDIEQSFAEGAAGYMVKPVDYEKSVETISAIKNYWAMCKMVQ